MGNIAEFNQIVIDKTDKLMPHALKLTQDIQDANDLVQETLLKALSNRDKFRVGTSMGAWLHTILRNTFFSAYQKKKRRKTTCDTTENLYHLNTKTDTNHGEGNAVMDDIEKSMEAVDTDARNYFEMYVTGFKYREIAEHYSVPLGTVKNRIHTARKVLQSKLAVYGN